MVRYRQTLLKFATTKDPGASAQNDSLLATEAQVKHVGKPAPKLPIELWEQIFSQLGTFALKKFRLVCRDWASLAACHLYETLYLNVYESSWAGLLYVCNSRHAEYVRRLVWNPVNTHQGSVDPAMWYSMYSNMLRGLKQYQLIDLYEAFVQAKRGRVLRTTSLELVAGSLSNLRNCQKVVFDDDDDFQSSCRDPYVVKGIHQDLQTMRRPSTWGIRPPSWRDQDRHDLRAQPPLRHDGVYLDGIMDVFRVLPSCLSITKLKLSMWYDRWDSLQEGEFRKLKDVQYLHAIHLEIKHFGNLTGEWYEYEDIPPLPSALSSSLDWLRNFPKVKEVHYNPVFRDPGDEFFAYFLRKSRVPETNDSDVEDGSSYEDDSMATSEEDTDFEIARMRADLEMPDDLPVWMTSSMAHSFAAVVLLTFDQLPGLRTITFSNCLLSAKAILCWLCCQPQVPDSGLHLRFDGTTILSQFQSADFFKALRQLNVTVEYDHDRTFYYRPGNKDLYNVGNRDLPVIEWNVPYGRYWVDRWSLGPQDWGPMNPEPQEPPEKMPPCPSTEDFKKQSSNNNDNDNKAHILCRPNELFIRHGFTRRAISFFAEYCIFHSTSVNEATDSWGYVCRLTPPGPPLSRLLPPIGPHRIEPLCEVRIDTRDDAYGDDYGYYYDFDPMLLAIAEADGPGTDLEREERAYERLREARRQQRQREWMVKAYENELLGLDVLITHFKLSPMEADRVWLLSLVRPEDLGEDLRMVMVIGD